MNKDLTSKKQKETFQKEFIQKGLNAQKASAKKLDAEASPEQDVNYAYYSRVLSKPFDSLIELKAAEKEYYDKLKAKEDKAAQKKADAQKVEKAFTDLNAARKAYKEALLKLTENYSADLIKLKEAFEANRTEIQEIMAQAEDAYSMAIKAFTEKYPEGYHLTLKDGDFETTISGSSTRSDNEMFDANRAFQMIDWLFNF